MKNKRITINVRCKKNKNKNKDFKEYVIPEGRHYSERLIRVETNEYKFKVRFDSSAIYTLPSQDQHDINKLTGFSDNNSHHQQFSARFGWRYSDNALRLFAYVYNDGEWSEKELSIIEIDTVYTCGIVVNNVDYLFYIKELSILTGMPRAATTNKAIGYKLYPYFGGNNVAPHDIRIWIKYL
jgi:hypothetical protein